MSDETPSPFNPDPFDEMVDKESRTPFQYVHLPDSTPPTQQVPIVKNPDLTVLYSERRHFKAFFKKLWWPKTLGIGAGLTIVTLPVVVFSQDQMKTSASVILTLVIICCFVYPIMRTHFWWRKRYIEVAVRKGQALITLYEPRSRLYGFKGDDEGVSFLLSGNVAIMLNQKTWAELYIFRKSAGGMIDTILDQDKVLHNLRDIYRPDLLKKAIEDAMDAARGV